MDGTPGLDHVPSLAGDTTMAVLSEGKTHSDRRSGLSRGPMATAVAAGGDEYARGNQTISHRTAVHCQYRRPGAV